MDSLRFMTCDELRQAFTTCRDDYNKRILIIDVRSTSLYERSHLCLDMRHKAINRRIGVLNIDPDLLKTCTVSNIMSILKPEDLANFKMRKECDEVVIVDKNTDDLGDVANPGSKVMRLINALKKFDNHPEKISDPKKVLHVLKGGFREWMVKYPHFTTNPNMDPELMDQDIKPSKKESTIQPSVCPMDPMPISPLQPSRANHVNPPIESTLIPSAPPKLPPASTKPMVKVPQPIMKPTAPPQTAKPNITKNAPGTAVPVTPILSLRAALPRSQSSPNVAQADGDEPDDPSDQMGKLSLMRSPEASNFKNDNNYSTTSVISKPRFDRTLKPAINNEHISAIRAQLNFGRSPEASGKAITGLQNLGNTCFMNSVIQCLAYQPELVSYFCSENYYNCINFKSQYGSRGELAIEFGALVEKLNTHRHRYIEPKSFREAVSKHVGFVGNEQQDSHEFMMMLFDKLHHDLNVHAKDKYKQNGFVWQNSNCNSDENNINIPRATLWKQFWTKHLDMNKSIISDQFEGIFMSTLTCTFCEGQSNTFEVFNCLSLPIASESRCHLKECLSYFSNPERIDAAWECPRCKMKREAEKKIVICKLPRVLLIHLKRFSLDGRWRQKLQTTVEFDSELKVDSTSVLPPAAYEKSPIKGTYSLRAVVNHYGHLDGGHYTAFGKLENNKWYTFDDSNVHEMKETDVCSQAAYILFYTAIC